MIGPLSKPQDRLVDELKIKDPALFEWLEEAYQKKIPVAFVNMGSISHLIPWSLKAITDGLKKLNCRFVWALRDNYREMAPEDLSKLPNFWVKSWIF